jgi:DNA-binding transcriptional MerR regulator
MSDPGSGGAELLPIDEVARRLDLRASAIRYYESLGLVLPTTRQAGRRWYGPAEVRRLAVIGYWQRAGLMTLEEIRHVLDGPRADSGAGPGWPKVVDDRITTLRDQIDRMEAACRFLEHVRSFHQDALPDGCPHYESLIWGDDPPAGQDAPAEHAQPLA